MNGECIFSTRMIRLLAACFLLLPGPAGAAPLAGFSASPTSGPPPLAVQFDDLSAGTPAGYAWFFGDETYAGGWTQMTAAAGWSARLRPAVVATPDGTLVLMGGHNATGNRNDVWSSTDKGATWSPANTSPGWPVRHAHAAVSLPDGSIVLTGGFAGTSKGDVWMSADNGATWSLVTASPGYAARYYHTMNVLPDGSIVIIGGYGDAEGCMNDVWRSVDAGHTWTLVTGAAPWTKRSGHTSVALPDGSLVLMGGHTTTYMNDVWRSEDTGASWTLVNASPGWDARRIFASVAMPDGTIVLTGGYDDAGRRSDVWISNDRGNTWALASGNPLWPKRSSHAMVVLPDASIVLMAGYDNAGSSLAQMVKGDVWRLQPAGSPARNPVHLYGAEGTYDVTLQVYDATGFDSMQREGYIHVGTPGGIIPLPGYTHPPTDTDGDGIHEDLNANGRRDFADVSLFFVFMEWITLNEPVAAFDLNANNRIDFADITALFGLI